MHIENLHDLFLHTLRDICFAEQRLLKKLPGAVDAAHDPQLRMILEKHRIETEEHVRRLHEVFGCLGERAEADECPAMEAITEEAEELMGAIDDRQTRDAAILAAAQAAEQYEIAQYRTLLAWAEELGAEAPAVLLERTLAEEKAMDAALTGLAAGRLNRRAVS